MPTCDCKQFDPDNPNEDDLCYCGHVVDEHEIVDLPGVQAGACMADY